MSKLKIFEEIYNYYVNIYLNELDNTNNKLITDTTLILNKLGEDLTSYNPQLKKHKTSKILIIIDEFNTF